MGGKYFKAKFYPSTKVCILISVLRAVFRKVFLGGNSPKVFLGKVVVFRLFKPIYKVIYRHLPSGLQVLFVLSLCPQGRIPEEERS